MTHDGGRTNNIVQWTEELFAAQIEEHTDDYLRIAGSIVRSQPPAGQKLRPGTKLARAAAFTAAVLLAGLVIAGIPDLHGAAREMRSRIEDMLAPQDCLEYFATLTEVEEAVHCRLPRLAYLPAGFEQMGSITVQRAGEYFIATQIYSRGDDYLNVCYETLSSASISDPSRSYSVITYEVLEDSPGRSVLISAGPPYSAEILCDALRTSIAGAGVPREEMLAVIGGICA